MFMAIVIGWQLFAYGLFGEKFIDTHVNIDVVKHYGKGTLIFVAIVWFLLIVGIVIVLYLKIP